MQHSAADGAHRSDRLKLTALIGVLGIVYGDIGTSPLYALQASLGYVAKGGVRPDDVLGLLSLMFWALITPAISVLSALASAYGVAVTGTFLCTNALAAVVFRRRFNWPLWQCIVVWGAFLVVDTAFFSANTLKVLDGGWVPLAIGTTLVLLMTTWRRGRGLLFARWQQDSLPLRSFLGRMPQSRIVRVPGVAVFLTGNPEFTPAALRPTGLPFGPMQASFFLGRETVVPAAVPKLGFLRRMIFLFMLRNAISSTEFFRISGDRVVELGVRVAV